jgi:hypothetical protein
MCDKCNELDEKIKHYERIASSITDQLMIDGIKKLIKDMQIKKPFCILNRESKTAPQLAAPLIESGTEAPPVLCRFPSLGRPLVSPGLAVSKDKHARFTGPSLRSQSRWRPIPIGWPWRHASFALAEPTRSPNVVRHHPRDI